MKYLFFSFITLTFCSHSQTGNTPTKKKCYEDSIDFEGYIEEKKELLALTIN